MKNSLCKTLIEFKTDNLTAAAVILVNREFSLLKFSIKVIIEI